MIGQYQSVFKGQGMDFDDIREYQPGDEVRHIDWNVTARLNQPFIKQYVEERELTVMLVVDLSASGTFGSGRQTKRELAAEVGAVLAFAAQRNNDKVGLTLFTERVEKYVTPAKGNRHVLRVVRIFSGTRPDHRGGDLRHALQHCKIVPPPFGDGVAIRFPRSSPSPPCNRPAAGTMWWLSRSPTRMRNNCPHSAG